jgi:hypothetical protein
MIYPAYDQSASDSPAADSGFVKWLFGYEKPPKLAARSQVNAVPPRQRVTL